MTSFPPSSRIVWYSKSTTTLLFISNLSSIFIKIYVHNPYEYDSFQSNTHQLHQYDEPNGKVKTEYIYFTTLLAGLSIACIKKA